MKRERESRREAALLARSVKRKRARIKRKELNFPKISPFFCQKKTWCAPNLCAICIGQTPRPRSMATRRVVGVPRTALVCRGFRSRIAIDFYPSIFSSTFRDLADSMLCHGQQPGFGPARRALCTYLSRQFQRELEC